MIFGFNGFTVIVDLAFSARDYGHLTDGNRLSVSPEWAEKLREARTEEEIRRLLESSIVRDVRTITDEYPVANLKEHAEELREMLARKNHT
jgi:hypothetical protein